MVFVKKEIKMRIRIPLDIQIISIWTVLTIIFITIPNIQNTIIRTILGIPFVLFIPGYVLISTLFPKKDDLDNIERIALSFGLSIAVVPLLGLLLNFTFGIRLFQILTILSIYIFALIILSIYRRDKISSDLRFEISFVKISNMIKNDLKSESRIDKILTIILIFSIIVAVGALIYVIVTPKTGEKFTEFYILGQDGKADNYPTKMKVKEPENILVGIVNHEYATINYTMYTNLDNYTLTIEKLTLNNNQTWEKNITFLPNKEGNDMKLEFLLYKENNFTAPYRDLHLWVNVTKGEISKV